MMGFASIVVAVWRRHLDILMLLTISPRLGNLDDRALSDGGRLRRPVNRADTADSSTP